MQEKKASKNYGREAAKAVIAKSYKRLTRRGGWAATGKKKSLLNALKEAL